jgi:hypothetical protein
MASVPAELHTKLVIDVDVTRVRRHLRRVIKDAREANRELADLQRRLGTLGGRLSEFGIGLEVGDDGDR